MAYSYRIVRNSVTGKYLLEYRPVRRGLLKWLLFFDARWRSDKHWDVFGDGAPFTCSTLAEAEERHRKHLEADARENSRWVPVASEAAHRERPGRKLSHPEYIARGCELFGRRWADPAFRARIETAAAFDELREETEPVLPTSPVDEDGSPLCTCTVNVPCPLHRAHDLPRWPR